MKALQKLILYPLCLLYVITPGSKRLEDNGSHYYDAIILGIFQALIIPGIIYYFSSAPQTTYFGLVASVGPWVGGWTFLGGIYYPILDQIHENDKKSETQKAKEVQDQKLSEVREDYDNRMRQSKQHYYSVLTENAPSDIFQKGRNELLLTQNGPACYKAVIEARLLNLEHRSHETSSLWAHDPDFVQREAERFGIDFYTPGMLRNSMKRADKVVSFLRSREEAS